MEDINIVIMLKSNISIQKMVSKKLNNSTTSIKRDGARKLRDTYKMNSLKIKRRKQREAKYVISRVNRYGCILRTELV